MTYFPQPPARMLLCMAFAAVVAQAASICSAALPPLLDAPWRGYDTGVFPDGFGPKTIAAGDIDGDGDLDVVVGNEFFGGPGISVLKNQGDGTYQLAARYGTPYDRKVEDVALLDMDGDGDLDVVGTITNDFGAANLVGLWRNNGDGSFATRVDYQVGALQPNGVAIADLNGDGFPDVITANYGSNSVSVLRHNGLAGPSAAFLPAVQFPAGAHAQHVAVGDLNGDGKIDLLVGGWDDVVGPDGLTYTSGIQTVLMNNGSGSFSAGTTYNSVPPPARGFGTAVALADVDNDGDLDLVAGAGDDQGSVSYGVVAVMRNNGSGTFAAAQKYNLPNFSWVPSHFATADLNGDGRVEIIATTPSGRAGDGYVVLSNIGNGNFGPAAFYPASQQTFASVAIDADGDGKRDVLTVAQSSAAVTVHKNPGNGIFPRPVEVPTAGGGTQAIDFGDIDGDGDLDIVTNEDQVRILKNNGDGTFAPAVTFSPGHNYAEVKLRDVNGDGKPDLLLGPDGNYPNYHFATALNNGNGTFAPAVIRQVFSCGDGSIDAVDLDGDGDLDVVLTEEEGCQNIPLPRLFVFRNDGPQQFTQMPIINPPGFAVGIAATDVNGDGKVDLVTSLGQGVGVFLGNGNLTYQLPIISSTRPYKFKVADFNGDGKPDVGMITVQESFGTVYVATALGNGDGTFQPAREQSGSSVLESAFRISDDIDVADMNGDGRPDLIVTNYASNDVSVFITNTDGSLRPHQRYGVGYAPRVSAVADFNGDGVKDVATPFALPPAGFQDVLVVMRGLSTPVAPAIQTAVSRKVHNGTAFDLSLPLTGTPAVEPRRGGGASFDAHQVVVTFTTSVTVDGVSVTSNNGAANATGAVIGNVVTIDLANVADAQNVTVTLMNVSNGASPANVTIPVSFLFGDSSGDRFVNAGDALQVRSRSGQTTDGTNFRSDVNSDGFVNTGDTLLVRGRSGSSLGPENVSTEVAGAKR